jgi:hypothetical protein
MDPIIDLPLDPDDPLWAERARLRDVDAALKQHALEVQQRQPIAN